MIIQQPNNSIALTYQKMSDICDEFSTLFIGYTMQPHIFSHFEKSNHYTGVFGESQVITAFSVTNQPCPIVLWTDYKQMMKFVKRKDDEMRKHYF